jgi:type I restriction enzyme R subunit
LEQLAQIYGFDVSLYQYIDNDNLKEHIQRVGKTFYHAKKYQRQQQQQQI